VVSAQRPRPWDRFSNLSANRGDLPTHILVRPRTAAEREDCIVVASPSSQKACFFEDGEDCASEFEIWNLRLEYCETFSFGNPVEVGRPFSAVMPSGTDHVGLAAFPLRRL